MIETKGVKHEKVKAAFEYAEIFVKESVKYAEQTIEFVDAPLGPEDAKLGWFGKRKDER